jgi:hypothetical protein
MAPTDATTTCHRYWTAYVVSNGKPVTLAMTYVRNDETEADAVERVLARVENYPLETELLLVDSGFFNERVIRRSREIAATVVHVPKKGDRMKEKLAQLVHDDLSVDSAGGVTTTCDPAVRFGFRLVAAILENLWLMLRWAVLARTGAGASDLKTEEFTFSVLCDWIWKEPEEQLERRWEIKMNGNGTGILASYQTTAG